MTDQGEPVGMSRFDTASDGLSDRTFEDVRDDLIIKVRQRVGRLDTWQTTSEAGFNPRPPLTELIAITKR